MQILVGSITPLTTVAVAASRGAAVVNYYF